MYILLVLAFHSMLLLYIIPDLSLYISTVLSMNVCVVALQRHLATVKQQLNIRGVKKHSFHLYDRSYTMMQFFHLAQLSDR